MNIKGFILLPISILYGLITFFRNLLFDIGIFSEKQHPVTIISVGNLSAGGTGKTPHVEYLVHLLKDQYKVATLSRGYGRKSKGFVLANNHSDSNSIGDEPLQYFKKFKNIIVAVDEKRNRGVRNLLSAHKDLDVIILDDAFQHRWIKPDYSILLTDFHQLYHNDYLLPSGYLREYRSGASRANLVVVTKTPVVLSPITRRRTYDDLKIKANQKLLFSKIEYDGFRIWKTHETLQKEPHVSTILLFTGIANSYPLQDYLKKFCNELVVLSFPDHHNYKEKDIDLITKTYEDLFTKNKIIITTEKDAQRLEISPKHELFDDLPLYYVPIHIVFHNGDANEINQSIKNLLS